MNDTGGKRRRATLNPPQAFKLHDLKEHETASRSLPELPGQVAAFGFILGSEHRTLDLVRVFCLPPRAGNTRPSFPVPIP